MLCCAVAGRNNQLINSKRLDKTLKWKQIESSSIIYLYGPSVMEQRVSLMIEIERNLMKHLPYLHVVKGKGKHAQLPVVVFLHGFTSAKEHNLHYAYLLAERGMRVILPEANLHGERSQGVNEDTLPFQFWEIVTTTINELALIKEQLHVQGWGTDRIGLAGTSMGGITLLGALTQYDWIKVGVCLMGSPHYEQFAQNKLNELLKLWSEITLFY